MQVTMTAEGSSPTKQQWGTSGVPGSSNIIITFTNSPQGTHLALDVEDNALVVKSLQTPKQSQQWNRNGAEYLQNGQLVADYSGTGSQVTLVASKIDGKLSCQQFGFIVRLICWERRWGHRRVVTNVYTMCAVCIGNVTIMMYNIYHCVLFFCCFFMYQINFK